MGVVLIIIIVLVSFLALIYGKGKDKLLALVPIVVYVVLSIIEGVIYEGEIAANGIIAFRRSPLQIVFTIINIVIFIGLLSWIFRYIQNKRLKRIEDEIDKT